MIKVFLSALRIFGASFDVGYVGGVSLTPRIIGDVGERNTK